MKAVNDWILVRYEEEPEVSEGGIILPTKLESTTCYAEVLDIGPNVDKEDDINFEVGSKVLIFSQPGVKYDHVRFTKLPNILGVCDGDTT